jgi:hypothetical protein
MKSIHQKPFSWIKFTHEHPFPFIIHGIHSFIMCFFAYMIFCLFKFVLIFWFMFWPIVRLESSFYHGSFSCNDIVYYFIKQSKGYYECTKDHLDNPLLCSFTKHMCLWSLQKLNTPLFLFPFFHDFFLLPLHFYSLFHMVFLFKLQN